MPFSVGDKVKVVRKIDFEPGWENYWSNNGMDAYVGDGNVYTIKEIVPQGVYFEEKYIFGWPPGSLDLATTAGPSAPKPSSPEETPAERNLRLRLELRRLLHGR